MTSNTYAHVLGRSGAFVRYLAGLNKHKIGANQAVYTYRYRRGGKEFEFNLGLDRGIHFGDSDTGTDGFWVHPEYLMDTMSSDGRSIEKRAIVPLDALLLTHDHADHYPGVIMDLVHNHRYNIPLLMGPSTVRHKYIVEAKKAGLPEDLIRRYFGTHDEPPGEKRFIELQPFVPVSIERPGAKLEVLPICLPHSSYLSLSYLIKAPNGTCYLHLSDFKSDMTIYPDGVDPYGLESVPKLFDHPAVKQFMDGSKLQLVGIESTNAGKTGGQTSEGECHDFLHKTIQKTGKRAVCFVLGGNQPRYVTLGKIAKATGRLLEVVGEANKDAVRQLKRTGVEWLNVKEIAGQMVFSGSKKAADAYAANPGGVLTIASGPNGEYIANLASALDGRIPKKLKLDPKKDMIILTASIIPGNEDRVLELVAKARRKGFDVVMAPLSSYASEVHHKTLREISAMDNGTTLVVTPLVHSSGHDTAEALEALAVACPDNPSFAIIHGGSGQRQALGERLDNAGLRVVRNLENGYTIPIPDKRSGAKRPAIGVQEFPSDVFLPFSRSGGFGAENAYQFGATPISEQGVQLKRIGGGGLAARVVKFTIEGDAIDAMHLNFHSNGPVRYDGQIDQTARRLRRPPPTAPKVRHAVPGLGNGSNTKAKEAA